MSIKIFYHITCIGPWETIMNNQIQKIIYSGLYDDIEAIYCYVLGAGNVNDYEKCISLLKSIGKKIIIQKTNQNDKLDESFTLSDIRNHIDENTKILYLHTKGVTRYNNTYTIDNTTFIIQNLFTNVMDWNNIMEFVLIKNYKACLEELKTHDVVGINYLHIPPHFSGNFWWCIGKYFLQLPLDVQFCEAHICLGDPVYKEMFNSGLAGYGHYFNSYKMINYLDTLKFITK